MCTENKYRELDERVDNVEQRLTKVETTLADMRNECRTGFADLKAELVRIYEARKEGLPQGLERQGDVAVHPSRRRSEGDSCDRHLGSPERGVRGAERR